MVSFINNISTCIFLLYQFLINHLLLLLELIRYLIYNRTNLETVCPCEDQKLRILRILRIIIETDSATCMQGIITV